MTQLVRETAGRSLITPRFSLGFVAGGLKRGDSETNPRMSLSLRLLQVCKLPLRFQTCGGSGDVALTEKELGAVFPFGEQLQMSLSLSFLGRM